MSLFDSLGARNSQQGQQGGKRNFAPELLRYMRNFQGNPLADVQRKVQSGEWTQEQYSRLRPIAEDIAQKMMGILPH